jgi:hypothetical protein
MSSARRRGDKPSPSPLSATGPCADPLRLALSAPRRFFTRPRAAAPGPRRGPPAARRA